LSGPRHRLLEPEARLVPEPARATSIPKRTSSALDVPRPGRAGRGAATGGRQAWRPPRGVVGWLDLICRSGQKQGRCHGPRAASAARPRRVCAVSRPGSQWCPVRGHRRVAGAAADLDRRGSLRTMRPPEGPGAQYVDDLRPPDPRAAPRRPSAAGASCCARRPLPTPRPARRPRRPAAAAAAARSRPATARAAESERDAAGGSGSRSSAATTRTTRLPAPTFDPPPVLYVRGGSADEGRAAWRVVGLRARPPPAGARPAHGPRPRRGRGHHRLRPRPRHRHRAPTGRSTPAAARWPCWARPRPPLPAGERRLAGRIAERGAVVSEFPLGTGPIPATSRAATGHRGLGAAVVVVEAGQRAAPSSPPAGPRRGPRGDGGARASEPAARRAQPAHPRRRRPGARRADVARSWASDRPVADVRRRTIVLRACGRRPASLEELRRRSGLETARCWPV
jgi:hypothetical protein